MWAANQPQVVSSTTAHHVHGAFVGITLAGEKFLQFEYEDGIEFLALYRLLVEYRNAGIQDIDAVLVFSFVAVIVAAKAWQPLLEHRVQVFAGGVLVHHNAYAATSILAPSGD